MAGPLLERVVARGPFLGQMNGTPLNHTISSHLCCSTMPRQHEAMHFSHWARCTRLMRRQLRWPLAAQPLPRPWPPLLHDSASLCGPAGCEVAIASADTFSGTGEGRSCPVFRSLSSWFWLWESASRSEI